MDEHRAEKWNQHKRQVRYTPPIKYEEKNADAINEWVRVMVGNVIVLGYWKVRGKRERKVKTRGEERKQKMKSINRVLEIPDNAVNWKENQSEQQILAKNSTTPLNLVHKHGDSQWRKGRAQYHSRACALSPVSTNRFHSALQWCILDRSFLSSITFSTQANNTFSSSGMKNDERSDNTLSKFADSDVMWSIGMHNPILVFIVFESKLWSDISLADVKWKWRMMALTSINPHYRNSHRHKNILPLQQECIPQPQLRLERHRICKKRNIPFRSIRRRRDHMFLERGIHCRHHLLR